MKNTIIAAISTLCISAPAFFAPATFMPAAKAQQFSSLYFNNAGKTLIEDRKAVTSDNVDALAALQKIKTPLQAKTSLFDYEMSLQNAQNAIADATQSTETTGLPQMQVAIFTHELALMFWKECLVARSEFLCDQNSPVVTEILRRYPKPQKIEELARNSPMESLRTVRKPWIDTRIRATKREVVEYIPTSEQRKVLQLLLQQAERETMIAVDALK
jgi:hypothetical protein